VVESKAIPAKIRQERSPSRSPKTSERPPLLLLIQGLMPAMKRAQRGIAEAVLRDPEKFITQTISELARGCGVSTGSIVLFCRSLGLKGFPALKIALARELAEPVLPIFKRIKGREGTSQILQRVLEEHVASLQQTLNLNTAQGLNAAATVMLKARRIVLFSIGLSYPVAYSIYARLRFIGLPAFIEYDSHLQLAAAAEMQPGEVALGISVAGNTSETVECLHLSQARGARTICITNSVGSPLARAADIRLYAAPSEVKYFQAPLASRVSQLALADALLVLLGTRRKRQAVAHLERAEEHLLRRRLEVSTGRAAHVLGSSGRRTPPARKPSTL
jgi:DNA-binding MurR/RpiR family transcriptional regulator